MATKDEILKAYGFAIELEKESLKSYLDLAKRTHDVTGKNMFIWLAREEYEHMRILESIRDKVLQDQPIGKVEIEEDELQKLLPDIKKLEKKKSSVAETHQIHALQAALEHEAQSRDFYKEQAEKTEDPELKQLFTRLAEMEQAHYDLILAQLDFIKGTGFWFGIPEFDIESAP